MKNGGSAAAGRALILGPDQPEWQRSMGARGPACYRDLSALHMDGYSHAEPRPRMRGRLHQIAFFASLPAGAALVVVAETAVARAASAVYALTVSGLYAASAAFHRIPWGPRAWLWMRRLDHSMIFVLIAGTYTPFALLVLTPPWSTVVLAVVWGGAAVGIVLRLVSHRFNALRQALYLTLGWLAVITLPFTIRRLGPAAVLLLLGGGIFYTLGAILFLRRVPRLRPEVFGYHEMWHAMVVGGTVCHYLLVLILVLRA
jgi:hemolysin III